MGSSLHVHEYFSHDHPDHHHGPASHEHHHEDLAALRHHVPGWDNDHAALQAESCDPGRHAVAVTIGCAHVPQMYVDLADVPGPSIVVPPAPVRSATPIMDIRVHGPPFHVCIPSRAPPFTHLA